MNGADSSFFAGFTLTGSFLGMETQTPAGKILVKSQPGDFLGHFGPYMALLRWAFR